MLKISIITVCYNSADTIEDTIKSVVSQDYNNIEYIIVDGKSTDATLQLIANYKNGITKIISEKDDGIYFALNKGIAAASGDVIAILHADDFYNDSQVISELVHLFETKNVDTIYGDLQYVNRQEIKKVVRNWKSGAYQQNLFLKGWMPPHPAFFVRSNCYKKFGVFNTTLKSSADYELMLRFLYKNNCSTYYFPRVLVKMRIGGKSNVTIMNRIKANREDKKAWIINNLKPNVFTFFLKPLSKLNQFFSKAH